MASSQQSQFTTIELDPTLLVGFSAAAMTSAMQSTRRMLAHCLRLKRIRLITLALIVLISSFASLAYGIGVMLWASVLLVAAWGLFDYLESRDVNWWTAQILTLWRHDGLELDAFLGNASDTCKDNNADLVRLCAFLPTVKRRPQPIEHDLRTATALIARMLGRCRADSVAIGTLMRSIVAASLIWTGLTRSAGPLLGCLVVLPLLGLLRASTNVRLWYCLRETANVVRPGSERRLIVEIARELPWGYIASWKKDAWLALALNKPSDPLKV